MRVEEILHGLALPVRGIVHAGRRAIVALATLSLLRGQRVSLTALGRGLGDGQVADKHCIKRIDRLLGNPHLAAEMLRYYGAIMKRVIGGVARPVLLIDWTQLGEHVDALVVAVPLSGRAIPILAETVAKPMAPRAMVDAEARILQRLAEMLPSTVRPILVGDAGFRSPFLRRLQEMHWDCILRVRGRTQLQLSGVWVAARELFARACSRITDLGIGLLTLTVAVEGCRFVLGRKPVPKRDKRSQYAPKRGAACGRAQRAAKEPWLLATTLTDLDAGEIIRIYRRRMRIEQAFRDAKSTRYGWSFDAIRSRSADRLAVLLMLVAIAMLVALLIGLGVEREGLHRGMQANTTRKRRVLSWFTLGCALLRRPKPQDFSVPRSFNAVADQFAVAS